MTSIDLTQHSLEAAVLDQKVAGMMGDKRYAYVAVIANHGERKPYGLGIAVADERGYNPVEGIAFDTMDRAEEFAGGMNEHIGLTAQEALQIVISSMRKTKRTRRPPNG